MGEKWFPEDATKDKILENLNRDREFVMIENYNPESATLTRLYRTEEGGFVLGPKSFSVDKSVLNNKYRPIDREAI